MFTACIIFDIDACFSNMFKYFFVPPCIEFLSLQSAYLIVAYLYFSNIGDIVIIYD